MPLPDFRHPSVLALAATLGLTGCAVAPVEAPQDDRPVVLTTFTVLADMTRAVAGDRVRVESITKVGAEIHGYEPTPSDLRRAADADLVLDNGLGLEAWFAGFVAELDVPHAVLTEGITPLPIDPAAPEVANPHAWMSPVEAKTYVANITAALTALDPAGADHYTANAAEYTAEITAVHDDLRSALAAVPEPARALVTCEGAFGYLARDAGLREYSLWSVNAEQQAAPQRLASVIEAVRVNRVPAVFCESTVSDATMRRVVDATGATFGGVLYVDSLSEPDGPVPDYLTLLRHDARLIADALTGGAA